MSTRRYCQWCDLFVQVTDPTKALSNCERCGALIGNVNTANIKAEEVRDWQRDRFHNDLLQPMDSDGTENEEFTDKYGYNPCSDKEYVPKQPELQSLNKDNEQQQREQK